MAWMSSHASPLPPIAGPSRLARAWLGAAVLGWSSLALAQVDVSALGEAGALSGVRHEHRVEGCSRGVLDTRDDLSVDLRWSSDGSATMVLEHTSLGGAWGRTVTATGRSLGRGRFSFDALTATDRRPEGGTEPTTITLSVTLACALEVRDVEAPGRGPASPHTIARCGWTSRPHWLLGREDDVHLLAAGPGVEIDLENEVPSGLRILGPSGPVPSAPGAGFRPR